MSIPQLVQNMCAELAEADLNAIRKTRGFSAKETASRSSFASFYLTSIGLDAAMQALTPEEAITLRLLHETGEVDVSFFERLYGAGYPRGTYSQRYKTTLDSVKKNLVRRGLLVMAEAKTRAETVQMERWRFALPPEFVPFLPPLPTVQREQPGQVTDHLLRKKLLQLLGGSPVVPNDALPIHIQHGSIYLEKYLFSLATFGIWQLDAWQRITESYKPATSASLTATLAVLKLLDFESWTSAKAIEPALKIYSFGGKISPTENLLKQGWELGLLARLEINAVPHYRLAPAPQTNTHQPDPAQWADTASKPGSVKVDLRLIPLRELDLLNSLAHIAVEDGALYAASSLVKLGRAIPAQRNAPLARWLAENVPAFGSAIETVNAKWGKTILHENLLFAQVRDLSLRVQLERELKGRLIVLTDNFIAFPIEARANVEKVLKKTGFVIRTVKG